MNLKKQILKDEIEKNMSLKKEKKTTLDESSKPSLIF
jgi:hypothetical protein